MSATLSKREPHEALTFIVHQPIKNEEHGRGGSTQFLDVTYCGMNPHQQVIERLRSIDRSDNFSAQNKLPSSREEIASIDRPWAARRIISARITSQYGDVYWRANDSRRCRSSSARITEKGLFLGIRPRVRMDRRETTGLSRPKYKCHEKSRSVLQPPVQLRRTPGPAN
jgi:hypothetical protein